MKILGVYGSPREGGNTDALLDDFLAGCAEAGAAVSRLYLRDICFGPCTECGGCSTGGECVIGDGMRDCYPLLRGCEGVVLASPIFFYGVTAQAKAFIDRAQPFWAAGRLPGEGEGRGRKKGFFISVGATGGEKLFEGARRTVRYFFDAIGADYVGDILHRGVEGKGDICRVEGALIHAFDKGRWFAARAG